MNHAPVMSGVEATLSRGKTPTVQKKPNLEDTADELGQLRADIRVLTDRQDDLEAIIRNSRKKRIEGSLFTVVVKRYPQFRLLQETLVNKIRLLMKDDVKLEKWIRKSRKRVPVVSIEVNAKNKAS